MDIKPPLSIVLLLACFLISGLAPATSAAPRLDEISKLVAQVKKERDDVDPAVFRRLANVKTAKAVDALKDCTLLVRQQNVIDRAVEAFEVFREDAELEPRAIEALGELCFDTSAPYRASKALSVLPAWGPAADPVTERVVREHNDPNTRSTACRRVAIAWAKSAGADRVRLLMENLDLMPPPSRPGPNGKLIEGEKGVPIPELEEALAGRTPELTDVMLEGVLDKKTDRSWRLVLLAAVVTDESPEVTKALARLTKDKDKVLSLDALHALGKRSDATDMIKVIAGNLKSKQPGQRRAAVVALGKLSVSDAAWPKELFKLAETKDDALRMGACHALADLGTPEAIAHLERLLDDDHWPVRAEAMWQLTSLRKKSTVPALIRRIPQETPRLQEEVCKALRILTAKDLGTTAERWERWWAAEGDAFEVGPLDEGLAAEQRREASADEGRSNATFFGLRIISDRVCFILDTSGSMAAESDVAATRMDAAKRQLVEALEKLPVGESFNMIFFSNSASAWKKSLSKMSDATRDKAIEAANDLRPDGGTAVYDALKLAFDDQDVDTIYLLTDGEPTAGEIIEPDRIRRQVAAWNETRLITLHTISVGRDSRLLQDLAEDSGGTYKRID